VRVLIKDKRVFKRVVYDSEEHFQDVVANLMETALPDFFIIPADFLVEDNFGRSARPDIVLIEKKYRRWFVIEVERILHSLEGHVLPQVETLANGAYSDPHATWLCDTDHRLLRPEVKRLVTASHPLVVVVADDAAVFNHGWKVLTERNLAQIATVEAFRCDETAESIAEWSGFEPSAPVMGSSSATPAPLINALIVTDPGAVGLLHASDLTMEFQDKSYSFRTVPAGGRIMLLPNTPVSLRDADAYEISLREGHTLCLKQV
jgi:hypothetical protein